MQWDSRSTGNACAAVCLGKVLLPLYGSWYVYMYITIWSLYSTVWHRHRRDTHHDVMSSVQFQTIC
jgi:hypothetical protein